MLVQSIPTYSLEGQSSKPYHLLILNAAVIDSKLENNAIFIF